MSESAHQFMDAKGRNLCDRCDRWAGAKVHQKPSTTTPQGRADAAVAKFQRDMQKLVDKGDMGRVTIRVDNGPEITVAQKRNDS